MIVLHESRATALNINLYDPLPAPVPVPPAGVFDAPAVKLCLNKGWVNVVAAVLERLAWEDAWEGDYADVDRAIQNANELYAALFLNGECDESPQPWDSGGGSDLLDCIELASSDGNQLDTINIRECECMTPVYVNIYDCCGCGDGGKLPGGGSGGGEDGGGGVDVGFPELGEGQDKKATVCDGAFYLAPYVISQGVEFIRQAKQFVDSGGLAIDFISDVAVAASVPGAVIDAAQEFVENLKNLTIQDFESAMLDVDFELRAQIAWVKAYGENTFQPDVTRAGLRAWARRLPVVWGSVLDGAVVSPAAYFTIFAFFANLQKINGRKLLAQGSSNSAFCDYVYSEAQVDPPALPPPSGSLPPPQVQFTDNTNTYRLTRVATGLYAGFEAGVDVAVSGENFEAIITRGVIAQENVSIGNITSIESTLTLTEQGAVVGQHGVGSGDITDGESFTTSFGRSDAVQLARQIAPDFFQSDFTSQQGNITTPDVGPFSGTVSFQNNTNNGADVELKNGEVWIMENINAT